MSATTESKDLPNNTVRILPPVAVVLGATLAGIVRLTPGLGELAPPPLCPPPQAQSTQKEMLTSKVQANFFM
jgi:hypothetical protein